MAAGSGSRATGKVNLRVVLVEDEDLFRDLIAASLGAEEDLEVVGSFGEAISALAVTPSLDPDVVLLDVQLRNDQDGIHLGLELRRMLPGLGIVVLSQHADPRFLAPLPSGAVDGWSYLLKSSVRDRTVLARAIRGTARGEVILDPVFTERQRPKSGSPLARLPPRQREILGLVAQGWTNSAIAEHLVVAEKSVENQLTMAYEHLGLNRGDGARHVRVQAVLAYLRDSVISHCRACIRPAPSG
jgi:DNA-binding NarL/FixJ family response regulator